MTHSDYRKLILKRIQWINEATGLHYETNFAPWYGGWNLTCEKERSVLAFDYRKTSKEMLAYLEGAYNGLTFPYYIKKLKKD